MGVCPASGVFFFKTPCLLYSDTAGDVFQNFKYLWVLEKRCLVFLDSGLGQFSKITYFVNSKWAHMKKLNPSIFCRAIICELAFDFYGLKWPKVRNWILSGYPSGWGAAVILWRNQLLPLHSGGKYFCCQESPC